MKRTLAPDVGGVRLSLGRAKQTGPRWWGHGQVLTHHVPSGIGALDRMQHTPVGQSPSPGGGKFGQT
jgi:hypothetical protein